MAKRARSIDVMPTVLDFLNLPPGNEVQGVSLRPLIEHAVAGNHDLAACGRLRLTYFNTNAAQAAQWTEKALTPENMAYLQGLPFSVQWRDTLLVHSSSYTVTPSTYRPTKRGQPPRSRNEHFGAQRRPRSRCP